MTVVPADGAIPILATQTAAKAAFEALRDVITELLGGEASTQLIIAGGVVTATRAHHSIDTEGATATDDLDRIAQDNHPEGRLLLIRSSDNARTVVVKHNAGGLGTVLLDDGVNFSLNSTKKRLLLRREGTSWVEVLRVYGDKLEEMRAWLQLEPDTVSTAANRNVTAADRGKVITLTGAADRTFTFTATPAQLGDGWSCYFKNGSTAFLTITPASGTIDGKASLILKPGELVEARSDGTNTDLLGGRLLSRERLTANRTYYVRIDGNDANMGLVNSAGGAFLTKQKAWDTIHDTLDLAGFVVTVQIVDSLLYTDGLLAEGWCVGQDGQDSIVFQGNNATPANVRTNVTSGDCFEARTGAQLTVKDMEVRTTTSGNGILAQDPGSKIIVNKVTFGACARNHMESYYGGMIEIAVNNYTISGGASAHMIASFRGLIRADFVGTVTLSGTPAFSNAFADTESQGLIAAFGSTYSGAATGKRYETDSGGIIYTNGSGASYFPGNVAGTQDTATSGHYV